MSALCDRCIKIEEDLENDDLAPDRDMSFLQKDGKVQPKFEEGWDLWWISLIKKVMVSTLKVGV